MDWKTVHGSQDEKPKELDICTDYVFVRRNIHKYNKEATDTMPAESGWEYDEVILPKKDYETFVKLLQNPLYSADNEDLKSRILNIETYIATSSIE